jgi:hypothetical protein
MPTAGEEKLWVNKAFAHSSLRMTAQNFDDRIRPKMPAQSVRGQRSTLRFLLPDVIATWAELNRAKAGGSKETDPLLVGQDVDSPGLERYRNMKADLAEMDRDERRGEIVPMSEILPSLQQAAGTLRQAIEHAARLYGNDVSQILNDALTETESAWAMALERNATANISALQASPANDQNTAFADNA